MAEPCEINTSKNWFDYDTACHILQERGVIYATRANPKADFAFTTQDAYLLNNYSKHTKRIHLSYGFSFLNNNFCCGERTCNGFDYKFVHGEYMKKLSAKHMDMSKIFIAGYPKHKLTPYNQYDKKFLSDELGINTDKKILCYFPTWDEYASISKYSEAIKSLKSEYFIVTKPHHCTARLPDKVNDMDTLREISDVIVDGNYDFAKVSALADIALCDAKSGSATEVPFLNPSAALVILFNEKFESYGDIFNPEILNIAKCVFSPDDLKKSVQEVAANDSFRTYRNEKMCDIYGKREYDYLADIIDKIFM